ncbi:hypothetical protein [Moraxella lacunata]
MGVGACCARLARYCRQRVCSAHPYKPVVNIKLVRCNLPTKKPK